LAGLSSRFDIEYYRDPKHWEYLSGDVVVNKESPSLFFKPLDANQKGEGEGEEGEGGEQAVLDGGMKFV